MLLGLLLLAGCGLKRPEAGGWRLEAKEKSAKTPAAPLLETKDYGLKTAAPADDRDEVFSVFYRHWLEPGVDLVEFARWAEALRAEQAEQAEKILAADYAD